MSTDFLDTVTNISIPAYDTGTDGPPRFYWYNGDKRQQTPGSFYIKADELSEVPGEPWQEVQRFEGERGYSAERLRIAVIAYRQQAFMQEGSERKVWLAEWREGAKIQTEVLCFVQGITQAPLVLVTKGNAGKAITQKGSGILAEYRQKLLQPAGQKAGRALPLWTFWLPILSLHKDGQVQYLDTGHKSTYTPPMVHPGIGNMDKAIETLFVGDQLYVRGAAIREEYDGWLKQRRGGAEPLQDTEADPVGFDRPAVERGARVPAGRMDDDSDMPF